MKFRYGIFLFMIGFLFLFFKSKSKKKEYFQANCFPSSRVTGTMYQTYNTNRVWIMSRSGVNQEYNCIDHQTFDRHHRNYATNVYLNMINLESIALEHFSTLGKLREYIIDECADLRSITANDIPDSMVNSLFSRLTTI